MYTQNGKIASSGLMVVPSEAECMGMISQIREDEWEGVKGSERVG